MDCSVSFNSGNWLSEQLILKLLHHLRNKHRGRDVFSSRAHLEISKNV